LQKVFYGTNPKIDEIKALESKKIHSSPWTNLTAAIRENNTAVSLRTRPQTVQN
jgi:hypothetical protein